MGGPLVRPKHFEFVNAEYLTLKGDIYAINGETLSFSNSSVDNLSCEKFNFPQIKFTYSTIKNFKMLNSDMKQWQFWSSHLNGKVIDSSLSFVDVYGGSFFADYRGCTFFAVTARHSNKNQFGFAHTYKTFKKIYADQGDDKSAIEYLLLEKKIERNKLRDVLFKYEKKYMLNETIWEAVIGRSRQFVEKIIKYTSSVISNVVWGYGRKPSRVVVNSIILILMFSLIYYSDPSDIKLPSDISDYSFLDSLYYSMVTFTTLGYGDYTPLSNLRLVAACEALLGAMSIGALIASLSNSKY